MLLKCWISYISEGNGDRYSSFSFRGCICHVSRNHLQHMHQRWTLFKMVIYQWGLQMVGFFVPLRAFGSFHSCFQPRRMDSRTWCSLTTSLWTIVIRVHALSGFHSCYVDLWVAVPIKVIIVRKYAATILQKFELPLDMYLHELNTIGPKVLLASIFAVLWSQGASPLPIGHVEPTNWLLSSTNQPQRFSQQWTINLFANFFVLYTRHTYMTSYCDTDHSHGIITMCVPTKLSSSLAAKWHFLASFLNPKESRFTNRNDEYTAHCSVYVTSFMGKHHHGHNIFRRSDPTLYTRISECISRASHYVENEQLETMFYRRDNALLNQGNSISDPESST